MMTWTNIGAYTENTRLILGEAGKYFVLLLFCVLAIRLWRRWAKIPASRNAAGFLCASIASGLAIGIAWVSMRQSLGSMDSYYGMEAFRAGRVPQALELFEAADKNWRSADTIGQKGVCLLMLGDTSHGLALISQARTMRKGKGTPFEDFYEGVYHFTKGEIRASVPLLLASSGDDAYQWNVIKLFAIMDLDENRPADAAELMKPYLKAEVTEFDQAYILASLKLADGNKPEARALLGKFADADLSPLWQTRFEKLRLKLSD
jgi:hypothetical protein